MGLSFIFEFYYGKLYLYCFSTNKIENFYLFIIHDKNNFVNVKFIEFHNFYKRNTKSCYYRNHYTEQWAHTKNKYRTWLYIHFVTLQILLQLVIYSLLSIKLSIIEEDLKLKLEIQDIKRQFLTVLQDFKELDSCVDTEDFHLDSSGDQDSKQEGLFKQLFFPVPNKT